jgi:hypothetical protein
VFGTEAWTRREEALEAFFLGWRGRTWTIDWCGDFRLPHRREARELHFIGTTITHTFCGERGSRRKGSRRGDGQRNDGIGVDT